MVSQLLCLSPQQAGVKQAIPPRSGPVAGPVAGPAPSGHWVTSVVSPLSLSLPLPLPGMLYPGLGPWRGRL